MSSFPTNEQVLDWWLARLREFRSGDPQARGITDGEVPGIRASQLGSCLNAQHRERMGDVPLREYDERTLRTFHHGDVLGRELVKMYRRLGLTRHGPDISGGETRLTYPDYNLTGHVDLILGMVPEPVGSIPDDITSGWSEKWLDFLADSRGAFSEEILAKSLSTHGPGHIVVIELKTTHSTSLRYLHKEGKPRFNNAIQAGAYKLMGDTFPEQLPEHDSVEYRVEYVGKDSFGTLSFPIGDEYSVEAERRAKTLFIAWDDNVAPEDVPCSCTGWEVEYCAFVELEEYDDKNVTFSCCRGLGNYTRKRKATDVF